MINRDNRDVAAHGEKRRRDHAGLARQRRAEGFQIDHDENRDRAVGGDIFVDQRKQVLQEFHRAHADPFIDSVVTRSGQRILRRIPELILQINDGR